MSPTKSVKPSSVNLVDPYVKKTFRRGIFSYHFKTGTYDHTEIQDIRRPGVGLAWTQDVMAQIQDIPDNPGWVATLTLTLTLLTVQLQPPTSRPILHYRLQCSSQTWQG